MPPLRKAFDKIGRLDQAIARRVGLSADCAVFCGIHDSNASLLPHLLTRKAPFSVVATGTWVISMAVGGNAVKLDEQRDTLANANAFGDPVPSARFMGGREFAMMQVDRDTESTMVDLERAIEADIMLMPTVQPGAGPFPNRHHHWIGASDQLAPGERSAAVSAYLGMMASTCLDLIAAAGPTVLEGPFAENTVFKAVLGFATNRPVVIGDTSSTGTSLGAALLANPSAASLLPAINGTTDAVASVPKGMASYVSRWFERANQPELS